MKTNYENCIKFDWFEFTLKCDLYSALFYLGLDITEFYARNGRNGYMKGLTYNADSNFTVFYDGAGAYSDSMGTHFVFTGSSMDTFYTLISHRFDGTQLKLSFEDKFAHLKAWFEQMDSLGIIKISRLDIAFDDYSYYTARMVYENFTNGLVETRFKKVEFNEKIESGVCTGLTYYFGSKHSNIMLRVYDKKLEQKCFDVNSWTRFEFVLRDNKAIAFLREGLANHVHEFDDYCRGLFYKHFHMHDENFCLFINNASVLKIGVPSRRKRTIESVINWFDKTCASSARTIFEALGGDESAKNYLDDMVYSARPRRDHREIMRSVL